MTSAVKLAFERETVTLPLERILPTKTLSATAKASAIYKTVEASVGVVGMVEPLVVFRQKDDTYILLEGHSRLSALLASGEKVAECLVSTDDTALGYKKWVSHLAPIQANKMIVKALDAGVPEDRLAKALNRPVATIRTSRTMLKDICDEALERDILLIDDSYGRNVVNLTIVQRYLNKLVENTKVVRYLAAKHGDLLTEFKQIQEAVSLEG